MNTGYDFKKGAFIFGPTASFNYTYVGTGGFTERGSLAPLAGAPVALPTGAAPFGVVVN